jgi:hypothetical protein
MVERIRQALETTAGKIGAVVLILAALVVMYMSVKSNLGQSDAAALSTDRMFVDAGTGEAFSHTLKLGEAMPVKAPSGGAGWPGEPCFWTKDGKIKPKPTWVLMNHHAKKSGPTFCPDCGRLVLDNNPSPVPGEAPPPTQSEYASRPREAAER